jgi:peptidoglycan L-alanyl-D-glutamate endopeptidase CwlK
MPTRTRKSYPTNRRFIPQKAHYVALFSIIALIGLALNIFATKQKPMEQQVLAEQSTPPLPTEINPNFLTQVEVCLIPIASAYGYYLDIAHGFRSSTEQDALYAQGRTTAGDIVTNAKGGRSLHNYGFAVDLVDDMYSYDIDWERIGKIGNYCGLEHGDRGYVDLPHFQHRGNLTVDDFAQGKRPPQLFIPCDVLTKRHQKEQPISKVDLKTCKVPAI